ncbi:MAG TPA: hypothetical protein VMK84_11045 [Streptosporangiaceae bacterium]|nr:hypothetical protein [Streptosporangiaceae bacterium]
MTKAGHPKHCQAEPDRGTSPARAADPGPSSGGLSPEEAIASATRAAATLTVAAFRD